MLVIIAESLNAELEIEGSDDKYHEYIKGEKPKLFNGIEKKQSPHQKEQRIMKYEKYVFSGLFIKYLIKGVIYINC